MLININLFENNQLRHEALCYWWPFVGDCLLYMYVENDYCISMYMYFNEVGKSSVTSIVEPLSRGHIGASHFVLCREVVRVQNVLTIWENEHLGLWSMSFKRVYLYCVLLLEDFYRRCHCITLYMPGYKYLLWLMVTIQHLAYLLFKLCY